ncbi:hypothetical protein TNCV_2429271 [Trichonephila clavipes]|nr:hypothetical protein TNCV_2429271 [Trichonephila clavipes]
MSGCAFIHRDGGEKRWGRAVTFLGAGRRSVPCRSPVEECQTTRFSKKSVPKYQISVSTTAVALRTKQMTLRLGSVHPNFEGALPGGDQGSQTSLPPPPISRVNLRLDGYLEYTDAAKTLYIYKHPCLPPGFEPRPYGVAVSVINHYAGWAVSDQFTCICRKLVPVKENLSGCRGMPQYFPLSTKGLSKDETTTGVLSLCGEERRYLKERYPVSDEAFCHSFCRHFTERNDIRPSSVTIDACQQEGKAVNGECGPTTST